AGAAGQPVVPGTARQLVVPGAAGDLVVAGTTRRRVPAGAARDRVPAVLAVQLVVAVAAGDRVVAGAAADYVVAAAAGDPVAAAERHDHVGLARAHEPVAAVGTDDRRPVTGAARDLSAAGSASAASGASPVRGIGLEPADDGEVAGARSGDDDLTARRHRDGPAEVLLLWVEVERLLAVPAERRVQLAARLEPRHREGPFAEAADQDLAVRL